MRVRKDRTRTVPTVTESGRAQPDATVRKFTS